MKKVLVSACLLGEPVRYDGRDSAKQDTILQQWTRRGIIVPFCPEIAGGLAVPREPAEIKGGSGKAVLEGLARVINRRGEDITSAFIEGAKKALATAKSEGVSVAILKEKSPSCGTSSIYDGSFSRKLVSGMGVTAALLARHGIAVFNEHQIAEAAHVFAELES